MTDTNSAGLTRARVDLIDPSPFQERKLFAEEPLKELAESIKSVAEQAGDATGYSGVIQPLVGRRSPINPDRIELVCGERRLRASKLAGLAEVPLLLKVLSDWQAENIVLTENIQREDLTPMEEARSYERMLKLRDDNGVLIHTRAAVAKLACKKLNHIDDHLKLLACPPEMQQAVDDGLVAVSVATVVGRIADPKLRPLAAAKVLKPDYQQVPMNLQQAKELVRNEFNVSLAGVPWKMDDASLVPEKTEEVEGVQVRCFGGACATCPFLSANIEGANLVQREGLVGNSGASGNKGGVKQTTGSASNLCTLPKCHKAKLDAVWKQESRKALQEGRKVLDDADAKKAFHPSHNQIANGSKYVCLDFEPVYHELGNLVYSRNGQKWRTLLKGAGIPVIVARNPHTGMLVELSLLKEAKPVGEKALRAKKPSAEEQGEKSKAQIKAEEDAKAKRKAELFQLKVNGLAESESITEIRNAISEGRVKADEAFYGLLFDMALDAAGSDGIKLIADTLKLPREKKAGGYGLEKPIKEWVKKNVETVPQWLSMLTFTMMARRVAWNGVDCEYLGRGLSFCGLKVDELKRRAKALLNGPVKGKGDSPAAAAPSNNSTDKNNWTTDAEVSKTAAADKIAKDAGVVRKVEDYNCDCCSVPIHCPPGTGAKLCVIPKGELKCKKCGGEWENRFAGWKREGFNLLQHPSYHAAAIALGEWTYEDCVGHEPQANTRSHKEWSAARAKIEKAVEKLARKKKKVVTVGAPGPAQALLELPDAGAAPVSGPSVSELVTGIQDSKIGKPGRFTNDDIDAAAKLLKAGTHKIADLIGPPPVRKQKELLKTYNAVRLRIMRKAGKIH